MGKARLSHRAAVLVCWFLFSGGVSAGQSGLSAADQEKASVDVVQLLEQAGKLQENKNYDGATALVEQALAIAESHLPGPVQFDVSKSLFELAEIYRTTGAYARAESLTEKVLAVMEKVLPPDDTLLAQVLYSLATIYIHNHKEKAAEPLYERCLLILIKRLGPDDLDVGNVLNDLALLYESVGDDARAEPLYRRAISTFEKTPAPEGAASLTDSLNNVAGLYTRQAQYAKAEEMFLRALSICEKRQGVTHPNYALLLNNIGHLYFEKGEFDRSESLFTRAISIIEAAQGVNSPLLLSAINNLGQFYQKKGRYDKAETLLQRSLTIAEKSFGVDDPAVARALDALASLSDDRGNYDREQSLYERALAIREKAFGPGSVETAGSLELLSDLYYKKADYKQAESLDRRALAIKKQILGDNHPEVISLYNGLGVTAIKKGDYPQAEVLLQDALKMREKLLGATHPDVASSLNNLATLYLEKGDYDKAQVMYERAAAIYEKALGREHPHYALALNNIAEVYSRKGFYDKAESLMLQALALLEKAYGKEHPDYGTCLNNLGELYQNKGNYVLAESFLQRGLNTRLKAQGELHPSVGQSFDNLGLLYAIRGDYARAVENYQRALLIMKSTLGDSHPETAFTLNNIGGAYLDQGDFLHAQPYFEQALRIWEQSSGNQTIVAVALNNLARIYESKRDYEKALQLNERALALMEKAVGPEHPYVAKALGHVAALYEDQGDLTHAEEFHKRALSIRQKALGPRHPEIAKNLENLSGLYYKKGELQLAVDYMSQALEVGEYNLSQILTVGSEEQKRLYLATLADQSNAPLFLHVRAVPDNPQALKLALTTVLRRKGRLLDTMSDAISALRLHADSADQALLERLASTRSQIATLLLKGPARQDLPQYRDSVAKLQDEADRLEAAISARNTEFRVQSQQVSIEAIQKAIPEDAALVEIAAFSGIVGAKDGQNVSPGYVAYVLWPHKGPQWVELGNVATIDNAIQKFRAALRNPNRTDIKTVARSVDEMIMRPIRKLLGETHTVFLSPDGAFNLIPFAALVDERDQYLVKNYSFTYLTSGRDLLRLQSQSASKQSPVIIVGPAFELALKETNRSAVSQQPQNAIRSVDFSEKFQPLDEAESEGIAIGKTLQGSSMLEHEKATESAIKQLSSPQILHINTHGFFLAKPKTVSISGRILESLGNSSKPLSTFVENPLLRSGLAFTGANHLQGGAGEDGILTALEASGLDLWGTKLVTLSACETGLGDVQNGEGVYGLRRAFVLAGAESLVMSLWKVNDKATRDFMVAYYKRLNAGEGRREALREVQMEILQNLDGRGEYSHPYYWAAFIESGDWRSLQGK